MTTTATTATASDATQREPLQVGQTARRSATLTHEHVRLYSELTGDRNPLHIDPAFTRRTRFRELIVQGGLTTGLLHALVAMDLPGPGTVFMDQHWRFTSPVFIGDTITAEVEVREVHRSKPIAKLGVRVTRQTGETVLEGEATVFQSRPSA
jgi:acyl dehydratase